jgi:hypothetical protein
VSPRKTQSCLFCLDIGTDPFLQLHPEFPSKVKLPSRFGESQFADVRRPDLCLASPPCNEISRIKKQVHQLDGSPPRHSTPSSASHSPLQPNAGIQLERSSDILSTDARSNSTIGIASSSKSEVNNDYASDLNSPANILPLQRSDAASETKPDMDSDNQEQSTETNIGVIAYSARLGQLPIRHDSSPLRPSQWTARGGLLKFARHQTQMPDRFISSRRLPNIVRESFELNKPAERLTAEERRARNGASTTDPFGRRLHRSGRLNEELRGLRETHSVLTGRTSMNRRSPNPNLRRSSFTQGNRQISAGAVWNVGGSSAASDTVVAVSNGRGGMLGSGTNAPLYTSMFLCRSDPEAELEAYERRLALALDVNQTDRVLQHTTRVNDFLSASPSSQSSHEPRTKHVWRDSVWIKDGVAPRSLIPMNYLNRECANRHMNQCRVKDRSRGNLCRFCHLDRSN